MPYSKLRFIKRCAEYLTRDSIRYIPKNTRGIYTLSLKSKNLDKYEIVYVGMSRGKSAGIRSRITKHAASKRKNIDPKKAWTHFSIYEVWDNISEQEIQEIEGLLKHLYRKSALSNPLNQQRRFTKLAKTKNDAISNWE